MEEAGGTPQQYSPLIASVLRPLVSLLADPVVLHISVGHDGSVWTERFGVGPTREDCCLSETERTAIVRLIASFADTTVTRTRSCLEAFLPSGERFQAYIPPTVPSPTFEVRKRPTRVYSLDDYVASGIMTGAHAVIIRQAIAARHNIVVAGGCGSGKTVLLNGLLHELRTYRGHVITLEDLPELLVSAPWHKTKYTSAEYNMTDLVRSTLRDNPYRVIVGEVRGGEALDVLDLWNTGHPGGMLTLHANPGKGLRRLESLVRRADVKAPLSQEEMRLLIGESVDLLVDIERVDGVPGRRVTAVTRCLGVDEAGQYHLEACA